jgi:hypothetical protein
MRYTVAVVGALLVLSTGCAELDDLMGSGTDGMFANLAITVAWPRLNDPGFVGTSYEYSEWHWKVCEAPGGCETGVTEVYASGRIPPGTHTFVVHARVSCPLGPFANLVVRGRYENRVPYAGCTAVLVPECTSGPQQLVVSVDDERGGPSTHDADGNTVIPPCG